MKTPKVICALRSVLVSDRDLWPFLPLALFVILHAFRPFVIGFYHDDWNLFVEPRHLSSSDLFDFQISSNPERPLLSVLYYLIDRIWNGRPATMTLMTSSFVGVAALSLYVFLSRIARMAGSGDGSLPALSTSLWISIPWGLGYSLWTTGATTLPAMVFFLLSSIFSIDYMCHGRWWRLALSLVTLLISYFTYQAWYMSFACVALLVAVLGQPNVAFYKRIAINVISAGLVQAYASFEALHKTLKTIAFNASFFRYNFFTRIPYTVHQILGPWSFILPLFLLTLSLITIAFMFRTDDRKKRLFIFGAAIATCVLGLFVATLPFSAAGYGLQGIGVFSRTTVSINLWLVTLTTILTASLAINAPKTKLHIALMLPLILLFTCLSMHQIRPWIESWQLQKQILSTLPTEKLEKMTADDIVILNCPIEVSGVTIFGAPWDISGAYFSQPKVLSLFTASTRPLLSPFYTDIPMIWDASKELLTFRPGWSTPAKHVWIFTPSNRDLREITVSGPITMPQF